MSISDQIVLMKDGAIQQVSTPSEIYLNPVNKFVASFIGSPEMNFIDVDVSDGVAFLDTHKISNLPENKKKVTLGFRAEDLELCDDGLEVDVVTVEILGRERLLTLKHRDNKYKMLVENTCDIAEGEKIRIRPKEGKAYVFDVDSEEFLKKC